MDPLDDEIEDDLNILCMIIMKALGVSEKDIITYIAPSNPEEEDTKE